MLRLGALSSVITCLHVSKPFIKPLMEPHSTFYSILLQEVDLGENNNMPVIKS